MVTTFEESTSPTTTEVSSSIAIGSSVVASSIAITSATSSLAKLALSDNITKQTMINDMTKVFALIISPHLIIIK